MGIRRFSAILPLLVAIGMVARVYAAPPTCASRVATEFSSHLFEAVDLEVDNGNKFLFRAEVDSDGTLEMSVTTRDMETKVRSRHLWAARLYDQMIQHFERQHTPIRRVVERWIDGTNLQTINMLTRGGRNKLEKAALETWGGRQAKKHGFKKAKILEEDGEPGHYVKVVVEFTKP